MYCPVYRHFGTRLPRRLITLHIMQRPTRESQRITLNLTQAACIELDLALAANFNIYDERLQQCTLLNS